MERVNNSGEVINTNVPFAAKAMINLESTDVHGLYHEAGEKMLEALSNFKSQGSNWRFKQVLKLDIFTVEYKPLKGKSYIPLPDVLAKKKSYH